MRWEMSILTICGIEMAGAQGRSFCRGCDSNCIGSARLASGFRKHASTARQHRHSSQQLGASCHSLRRQQSQQSQPAQAMPLQWA